jgi:hypothetical protein
MSQKKRCGEDQRQRRHDGVSIDGGGEVVEAAHHERQPYRKRGDLCRSRQIARNMEQERESKQRQQAL